MASRSTDIVRGYRVQNPDKPAVDNTPEHLRLKKGSQALLDELHARAVTERANCLNRWQEFDGPVSQERAQELCNSCPIFALCDSVRKKTKPTAGIWAGVNYTEEEA